MTTAAAQISSRLTRAMLSTAFAIALALSFQASAAQAYPASVKRACTGDYLAYCAHTKPGSAKLSRCMRKAGPRLSRGCVSALMKHGYVSKSEVKRRAAQR